MELCSLPAIYLGPNYGGGNEDNADLPPKIPGMYCYSLRSQPCRLWVITDPRLCQRLLDTHQQVSCGVTVPFSWALVHKALLCPPGVYFPVLCKFWQLYSGVNGDLLQEGLCHTHTQSPCPCTDHCRPVPPQEIDAQTQFCLGLCGVPESW